MTQGLPQIILVLLDILLWGTILFIAIYPFKKAKKSHIDSK